MRKEQSSSPPARGRASPSLQERAGPMRVDTNRAVSKVDASNPSPRRRFSPAHPDAATPLSYARPPPALRAPIAPNEPWAPDAAAPAGYARVVPPPAGRIAETSPSTVQSVAKAFEDRLRWGGGDLPEHDRHRTPSKKVQVLQQRLADLDLLSPDILAARRRDEKRAEVIAQLAAAEAEDEALHSAEAAASSTESGAEARRAATFGDFGSRPKPPGRPPSGKKRGSVHEIEWSVDDGRRGSLHEIGVEYVGRRATSGPTVDAAGDAEFEI